MNRFTSFSVNRWLTGVLCLSLLISILGSSTRLILRNAAAQTEALPAGKKLGEKLPDLAHVRYKEAVRPAIADFGRSSNPCFDCKEPEVLGSAFSEARLDPANRTGNPGVDLLSQNIHWSLPLMNLKGRAGLDLNLSLVYNSLVWTKAGSQIAFDADRGQPSPGFRLGFPTIQHRYRDAQSGKNTYLLITPEGSRVDLRQVDNTNVYRATDNSLLQMIDQGARGATLRRPDGTRLSFSWAAGQLQCTEVKDRNGNYVTVGYDKHGHLNTVTDTLGRTFVFTRDEGGNLVSIRQKSDGPDKRVLATFGYSTLSIQTNFIDLKVVGPTNGSVVTTLTQVGLPDGSHYQFDYTSWGQIRQITKYAPDGHALNYVSYNLLQDGGTALADTPRSTQMRNWAEGTNNEAEVVTRFDSDLTAARGQMTLPDGSVHKEIFANEGWQRGLLLGSEEWSGGVLQKRTTIQWIQDDASVNYRLNPRAQEKDTVDSQGNHQRIRTAYGADGLPSDVYNYSLNGLTVKRHTHFEYNSNPEYIKRHIMGLVSEQLVYGEGDTVVSKTAYEYDLDRDIVDQGSTVQHDDREYGPDLLLGRGLLCATHQWSAKNIGNPDKAVTVFTSYNTNGSVTLRRDSSGHQTSFSYDDDFSDGKDRGTRAYATKSFDAAGKQKLTRYDFEAGNVVWTQDSRNRIKVFVYDEAGRRTAVTDQSTGATLRKIYDESGSLVATFRKLGANFKEFGSYTAYDGAGRIRAQATDPLTKAAGYSGVYINRDALGRVVSKTKRTKMSSSWVAAEPVAISTNQSRRPRSGPTMVSTVANLGKNLLAGLSELGSAVEPSAYAQSGCVPGYYCGSGDQPPGGVAGYDEDGNLLLWSDGNSSNVLLWVNVSINDNPQESDFLSTTTDMIAQLEPLPEPEENEFEQEEDAWERAVQEVEPPDSPDINVPDFPIISYRVDDRSPDEIYGPGFVAWGNDMDLWEHVCGNPDSGYVSTTLDVDHAYDRAMPGEWIYMVQGMGEGVDVNQTLGGHPWEFESEIAYPNHINSEDIIGAREVLPNGQLGPIVPNPSWVPHP